MFFCVTTDCGKGLNKDKEAQYLKVIAFARIPVYFIVDIADKQMQIPLHTLTLLSVPTHFAFPLREAIFQTDRKCALSVSEVHTEVMSDDS